MGRMQQRSSRWLDATREVYGVDRGLLTDPLCDMGLGWAYRVRHARIAIKKTSRAILLVKQICCAAQYLNVPRVSLHARPRLKTLYDELIWHQTVCMHCSRTHAED